MAQAYAYTVYRGTFIQTPRLPDSTPRPKTELVRNRGALWVSSADGRIKGFDWQAHDDASFKDLIIRKGWVDVDASETNGYDGNEVKVKIVIASEDRNEFFFPGFIGCTPSALRIYDQVVARTLSHGTTCASYFATVHVPATNALAALCHSRGQRAFIGRVCMDNPDFCPSYYKDLSADDSVSATRSTIEYIHSLDPKGTLVKPIVTPRFAPTCTRPALEGLGKLAAEYNPPLHIQTHISENTNEVVLVKELFPESKSYADVYDKYNLLTKRTILAHAVHLTPEERTLVRQRDAKISHCPASNSALGSGIAPVRVLLDEGITVGLGTDVSGGYSPSILEAARQACLVSRLLGHTTSFCKPEGKHSHENGHADKPTIGREKLSVEESLYLATRGGAAVVDMADDLGGFDEGMIWDAQLIELGGVPDLSKSPLDAPSDGASSLVNAGPVGNVDLFGAETWEEKIHKWVWSGDDRNVKAVWVAGRLVHSRS